jgi:hypothetical protein
MIRPERHRARTRTWAWRLPILAVVLAVMALAAGCSGNGGDAIASIASSLSNRPTQGGGGTTGESTSEIRTTEANTTANPGQGGGGGETSQAGSQAASSGVPPWVWVVLGLVVLAGVIALLARARGRTHAADRSSTAKALDAYSKGVALHDRLQAELLSPPADGPLVSAVGVSEAQRMMDGLAASLTALSLEASQDAVKAAAGRVSLSLTGLRSALQLAATAGPASEARVAVATTLRDRLEDFAGSLGALRSAAQGQPVPPTAA